MSNASLSNVLLPAVFISSAVFSTLTVPFALIKSEPVAVEVPPFFSGEIQPIFNGDHKDVAIPYIGFAIVVSVGAGIASVEVHRRWQQLREAAMEQESSPNVQQNSQQQEAQQEPQELPEYRPEVSAISFSPTDESFGSQSQITPEIMKQEPDMAGEVPENVVDATHLFLPKLTIPPQTTAPSVVSEELELSQESDENNSVGSIAAVKDLNSAFSKVLESRQQYQTCRIKVPHLERRLFAIGVNGEYYSFLRAERTKERVLEVMTLLSERVEKTVLTKTEKGYVIWAWEPEAFPAVSGVISTDLFS